MNKAIYILILLSLLNFSCHKEGLFFKCKPENTIKVPQHAMDFFYFKTGTWWVYECEQTGYRDSLYVKINVLDIEESKNKKKDCGCGWGKCFEDGGLKINSKQLDSTRSGAKIGYNFNHYDLGSFNKNPKYGTTEISEGYEDQTNLPGYRMNYEENTYYNPTGNGATLKEIDSITVKGNTFKNIMEYRYIGSGGYPDWYQVAWYGKNMHLVKYIKTDSTVWNLIKWNIVQ